MDTTELLTNINSVDKTVPQVVEGAIPAIKAFVDAAFENIERGGRLFYIGAGTSGRLGVLDASECPPTFGVDDDVIIGLIAGGDLALRKAVENAEDDKNQAWKDLSGFNIHSSDVLLGIAASGTTPYVIGGLKAAQKEVEIAVPSQDYTRILTTLATLRNVIDNFFDNVMVMADDEAVKHNRLALLSLLRQLFLTTADISILAKS